MSQNIDKPSKRQFIQSQYNRESKESNHALSPIPIQIPITPSKFDSSNAVKNSDKGKSILEEIELLKLGSKKDNDDNQIKNQSNLNKASFSVLNNIRLKTVFKESKYFNETISGSVKQPKSVYTKGLHKLQEHKNKIGKAKRDLIKREMSHVQRIPRLSPNTKKIIKEKFEYVKPIYLRFHEVIEDRKREKESLSIKYEKPELVINVGKYDKERFDSWVDEKYKWSEKRRIKILEKKIKKENDEFSIIKKFSSSVPLRMSNANKSCENTTSEPFYNRFNISPRKYEVSFTTIERKFCPSLSLGNKDRKNLNVVLLPCTENEVYMSNKLSNSLKSKKDSLGLSNKTSRKTQEASNLHFTLDRESSRNTRWQDSIQRANSNKIPILIEEKDLFLKMKDSNSLARDLNKENNIYYNDKNTKLVNNLLEY